MYQALPLFSVQLEELGMSLETRLPSCPLKLQKFGMVELPQSLKREPWVMYPYVRLKQREMHYEALIRNAYSNDIVG